MTKIYIIFHKLFVDLFFNYFITEVRVNYYASVLKITNYEHACNYN